MHKANIILIGKHTENHDVLINVIGHEGWNFKSYSRFEDFIYESINSSSYIFMDVDVFLTSPISSHDLVINNEGLDCRQFVSTHIIVYSLTGDLNLIELALNRGADDFVAYPFNPAVILAKLSAYNRRYRVHELYCIHPYNRVEAGALILDPILKHASINHNRLDLTRSEFNIIYTLYKNPDHIFSKDHLLQRVTGQKSFGDHNALMTHISRLRKKISAIDPHNEYIVTVRNHGYTIKESAVDTK